MIEPGLGSESDTALFQEIVERRVLRIHFRAPHGVYHDRSGVRGAMRTPRCGHQPVIVICRHQHEIAPPVPRDLHRLSLRLMLELAELALKLHGGRLGHGPSKGEADYTYYQYYTRKSRRIPALCPLLTRPTRSGDQTVCRL